MEEENKNPFKCIGHPPQEVPKDLKKKVIDDVNSIKLLMDFSNLFSSNYAASIESFFKTKKKEKGRDNKSE